MGKLSLEPTAQGYFEYEWKRGELPFVERPAMLACCVCGSKPMCGHLDAKRSLFYCGWHHNGHTETPDRERPPDPVSVSTLDPLPITEPEFVFRRRET